MEFQKISGKAKGCMMVNEVLLSLICTMVLGGIWWFFREEDLPVSIHLVWVVLAVIWVVSLAAPFVRHGERAGGPDFRAVQGDCHYGGGRCDDSLPGDRDGGADRGAAEDEN